MILVVLVVVAACGLLRTISPVAAIGEPGPTPTSTVSSLVEPTETATSSVPGSFSLNDELTPIPQGPSVGTRFVVRTSTTNPTEYMELRAALVQAGFVDSIEVSPGSFLVATGAVDAETARTVIESIPGVLEVLRTNSATTSPDHSTAYPSWWAAMIATLIAASVVFAVSKSRSDQN